MGTATLPSRPKSDYVFTAKSINDAKLWDLGMFLVSDPTANGWKGGTAEWQKFLKQWFDPQDFTIEYVIGPVWWGYSSTIKAFHQDVNGGANDLARTPSPAFEWVILWASHHPPELARCKKPSVVYTLKPHHAYLIRNDYWYHRQPAVVDKKRAETRKFARAFPILKSRSDAIYG